MCGIIGYTGPLNAKDVVIGGLEQLEYRGYDSAGIALQTNDHSFFLQKEAGPVAVLKKTCETKHVESHCGIGHTRWATHGGVTDTNAHPHTAGDVTLIHNGIIENYQELIERFDLRKDLVSETDSEVAARLFDHFYNGNPYETIRRTVKLLKGSYSFCIMFSDISGDIYCVRNVSPLVAADCEGGAVIASDLTALIAYSKEYFVLPEYNIAKLSKDGISVCTLDEKPVEPEMLTVNWDIESAQKGGYPHYMIKEINEQPEALANTITPRLKDGLPDFSEEGIPDELLKNCNKIAILACGTAMYAGIVGKMLLEPMIEIPVSVNVASEFRYEKPLVDDRTLAIVISQSGETIDTLEALRLAQKKGAKVISIVNVKGSTIARESDYVFYTHAGPEIAVASTKAYTVQLSALYLLSCRFGLVRGKLSEGEAKEFIGKLQGSIPAIEETLKQNKLLKHVSEIMSTSKNAFFIGRGLDYAFSLEGALKLKEISYIHAEAYAAGELKHGTIALIEEKTPVISIATQDHIYNKTISNVREVKSRGAFVVLITKEGAPVSDDMYDIHLQVPTQYDAFSVFPVTIMLQLIAYYTSDAKGLNVDKPRNLAKSVTVE